MSSPEKKAIGSVGWFDLTVPNAEAVRTFYEDVVGWKSEPVSMGDYDDYSMFTPDGKECVAGVCHARGSNVGLPPYWMIYITVEDMNKSIEACLAKGGTIISGPRQMQGYGHFCFIKDPAGANVALFEQE